MSGYTEQKLDITADDKIFTPRGVGALNIGVVQCLSELIANSLDWRRFNAKEVESIQQDLKRGPQGKERFLELYGRLLETGPTDTVVRIRYNGDSIEIWDNGIGMMLDQLEVGLKLRAASDTKREPLRSRKGMFGMGMKIGILGMGWKFTIRTRPLLDKVENAIEIDTRQIEKGELKLRDITGRVYKAHDKQGPLGDSESGTYIHVENLHKKRHNPAVWREELGRNFSPEIQFEGVQIVVIDNSSGQNKPLLPCEVETVEIMPDTKIDLSKLHLKVRPDHGDGTRGEPIEIRGWLGLRKVSSAGRGRWGLHTFRKGQLVEAFHHADCIDDDGLMPYRPHPQYARVHGELHLDMCDPNFTKVGWNTELESWSDVRETLKPYLTNMMNASRDYRVGKSGGAKSRKFVQKAKEMAKDALAKLSLDEDIQELDMSVGHSRDFVSIGEGKYLRISLTQQARTDSKRFWEYSYRPESREMAVVVNTESDLWQWAQDSRDEEKLVSLIISWAIVDSLYFCLVDDMGVEPSRAIDLRDDWHAKLYQQRENDEHAHG